MGWKDAPEVEATPAWASAPEVSSPAAAPEESALDKTPVITGAIPFPVTVGQLKSAGHGALKAITLGHRLDSLIAAGLGKILPGDNPGYSDIRKEALAWDRPAAQAHPIAFKAGEVAPSLAVPGGAFSTLGRSLLTGGAIGAAQGITDTETDDPATLARNAGKGALMGAGFGAVGYEAPAVAKPVAGALDDLAVAQGRRVLTGGSTPLQATKEPLTREAVEAALDTGAIKPLGTVKGTAERLAKTRADLGDQYGRIIEALRQRGIEGPEADTLAQQMIAEGRSISANSLVDDVPELWNKTGESLKNKPTLPSGRLDLKQAEDMKRSLQDKAKYGRFEDTDINEARQDIASTVRKATEDAIGTQAAASNDPVTQAIAGQFQPVKEDLGNIIAASRSANRAAGKAATARGISLTDTIAGASGIAGHGPKGAVLGLLNHFARTRGASSVSWAAHAASDKIAAIARVNPATLGKYGAVLGAALTKGDSEFNAHYFVLGQTDPEFRKLTERLTNEGQ